jgi:hypothetical protein
VNPVLPHRHSREGGNPVVGKRRAGFSGQALKLKPENNMIKRSHYLIFELSGAYNI